MTYTEKARRLAKEVHRGQTYGEFPYFIHLHTAANVAYRVAGFVPGYKGSMDDIVIASIYLHDILEDTETTVERLKEYPQAVIDAVVAVTEQKHGTRKERHAECYPRIHSNLLARIVKLCDRISHLEFGGKKVGMYLREHDAFVLALYNSNHRSNEEHLLWDYYHQLIEEHRAALNSMNWN